MARNLTDKLAIRFTDAFIQLDRFTARLRNQTLTFLHELQNDLRREIRRFDLEGVSRTAAKRTRAEKLIAEVKRLSSIRYGEMQATVERELVSLAEFQHEKTVRLTNNAIQANIVDVTLTRPELKKLLADKPILGLPIKEWFGAELQGNQRRFAQQVRLGLAAGETNEQLVQRIVGRPTGKSAIVYGKSGKALKVREFAGGILDIDKNHARTLVRTAVQSVSNTVLEETYQENVDVLKGRQALVTLDNRTSDICIARSGASWDFQGKPLPESSVQEPFPGEPPWHPNCRTILLPITKSWEELLEESGTRFKKTLNTVPDSSRASMDGQISGQIRTFEDWLKLKGDAAAEKILGRGRFELWKKKKINLAQLIDQSGKPRTLEQLKDL